MALLLSVIVAVAVYFVVLVNIGGVSEEDMDNLPMGHKLELLQSSPANLEEFAREEFLMCEPGEDVFVIEP